jgi:uncharacterized protein (UPF0248 family)
VHRGAKNDTKIIKGSEIKEIERSFIELDEAMIPYHRIFKIVYEDKVIYYRKKEMKE